MNSPSWFLVSRIYREARASIHSNDHHRDDAMKNQGYLRRVSREFHKRLKAAGIHVEGAQ
jgi:hypothetical protein